MGTPRENLLRELKRAARIRARAIAEWDMDREENALDQINYLLDLAAEHGIDLGAP